MKKYAVAVLVAMFCLIPVFADDVTSAQESSEDFSVSVLDEKFLINVPRYFDSASYQNPAGEKFSHKEVTRMIRDVSGNETYMRQYTGWFTAMFAFMGIFGASLALNLVCTFSDDLPNERTLNAISLVGAGVSISGMILSASIASSKYDVAVDNYNLSLLGMKAER